MLNILTCVLIFTKLLSETFLIIRGIQQAIIVNVYNALAKIPVILDRF